MSVYTGMFRERRPLPPHLGLKLHHRDLIVEVWGPDGAQVERAALGLRSELQRARLTVRGPVSLKGKRLFSMDARNYCERVSGEVEIVCHIRQLQVFDADERVIERLQMLHVPMGVMCRVRTRGHTPLVGRTIAVVGNMRD